MKERTLSTKDICKLIQACKSSGVNEFKLDTLQIIFRTENAAPPAAIPEQVLKNTHSGIESYKNLRAQKLADEKEDTALLIIENPLEMERRIASGELIDEAEDT